MLDELYVSNLGVIRSARLEPGGGLVVVTGETGAGKTLLLGAIRLLTGTQARLDLVGPFGDEARVEGRFVTGEGEVAVARRMTAERSRAYLDGQIVSAAALEAATSGLTEIVAQHDQLSLARPRSLRRVLDRLLDDEGRAVADRYRRAFETLGEAEAAAAALGGDRTALQRELDVARHQAEEIAAAGFGVGEDEALRHEVRRLRHAEELGEGIAEVRAALERAADELGDAIRAARRLSRLDPDLAALVEELEGAAAQAGEAATRAREHHDLVEVDPDRLEAVERRLHLLGELQRRYGPGLDDVLDFAQQAAARAAELEGLITRADQIDEELQRARRGVLELGAELREARRAAGRRLAAEAHTHLTDLGLEASRLEVAVDEAPPGPEGADRPRLLFASDHRLEPGDIGRIASGGELSRLVLAVRLASGLADAPTLLFDEVDAGVGGATALALGRKLAVVAEQVEQVLVVTHLPQVAAFADHHFVVERTGNEATVRRVAGDERVAELTRMLAGLPDSDRGRQAAAELLALAGR